MKKFLTVLAFLIVASLAWFIFSGKDVNDNSLEEESVQNAKVTLFSEAENANMVMIASVGLGKEERRRIISGRLYRNFVQLLKTNGTWNEADSFAVECNVGLRLEFYKDTTLLREFRLTDRIGREGELGVWHARRMAKLNKFLKDQGVQFLACIENDHNGNSGIDSALIDSEKKRPMLTMPEFGAARKARKNLERESARDSVVEKAAGLSRPDSSMIDESQNALKILDELILPSDTAVGEPLSVLFKQMKNGTVSFFNEDGSEQKESFVALSNAQMTELEKLFSQTRLETFSKNGDENRLVYSKITLFGDNGKVVQLWKPSKKSNYLLKFHEGDRSSFFEGYWVPQDSEAFKAFFDSLK